MAKHTALQAHKHGNQGVGEEAKGPLLILAIYCNEMTEMNGYLSHVKCQPNTVINFIDIVDLLSIHIVHQAMYCTSKTLKCM